LTFCLFVQVRRSAILKAGVSLDEELAHLFAVLDHFIEQNIRTKWGTLCEDYTFVLESEGPSSVAEALNRVVGTGDSALVLPEVVLIDRNNNADAEGDIEELGEKTVLLSSYHLPQPCLDQSLEAANQFTVSGINWQGRRSWQMSWRRRPSQKGRVQKMGKQL
jgi:hypothetical protein